jgi:hypothetical protein
MSEVDTWTGTWCPQCGPDMPCDEEGCCHSCGAMAVGEGAEQALALRRAHRRRVRRRRLVEEGRR